MADTEEPPLQEGTEALNTPPEDETVEQQPDPIEALAAEMGWAPKDKFRGDEADWKPAADFIKAGRDINRSISTKLRSVEEQLSRVGSVTSQIIADKIADRDAYWQNVQAKGVEDGDNEAVNRAVAERVKLATQTPAATTPVPTETSEFTKRHEAWFGKDPLATMRAEEIADNLAKRGVSIPDQLAQVERAIRKEFPEHFAPVGKQPPGVQTSSSRNAGQGNGKKGFAHMPPESQALAKDMLAREGVPLEKFAERYWQQQAQRMVG